MTGTLCAAFLACVANAGIDARYAHQLVVSARPPVVEVLWDGAVDPRTQQVLHFCGTVVMPHLQGDDELHCQFHQPGTP